MNGLRACFTAGIRVMFTSAKWCHPFQEYGSRWSVWPVEHRDKINIILHIKQQWNYSIGFTADSANTRWPCNFLPQPSASALSVCSLLRDRANGIEGALDSGMCPALGMSTAGNSEASWNTATVYFIASLASYLLTEWSLIWVLNCMWFCTHRGKVLEEGQRSSMTA